MLALRLQSPGKAMDVLGIKSLIDSPVTVGRLRAERGDVSPTLFLTQDFRASLWHGPHGPHTPGGSLRLRVFGAWLGGIGNRNRNYCFHGVKIRTTSHLANYDFWNRRLG